MSPAALMDLPRQARGRDIYNASGGHIAQAANLAIALFIVASANAAGLRARRNRNRNRKHKDSQS